MLLASAQPTHHGAIHRAVILLFVLTGCPAPLWAPPDPARQFLVGFDIEREIRHAAEGFEADGFEVEAMVFAENLGAFGVRHPDGRTRVRVATASGWSLGLTAPSDEHTRPWVRLVGLAPDVDQNGHEELLVSAQDAVLDVECIAALEWRSGVLQESLIDLQALGASGCIVGLFESGGRSLFVARLFFPQLGHGRVPSIALLYGPGLELVTTGPDVSRFYDQQRRAPSDEEDSRADRWAQGVEHAALAFALGLSAALQRSAFEQEVVCRDRVSDCDAFFRVIARGWGPEELDLPELSGLDVQGVSVGSEVAPDAELLRPAQEAPSSPHEEAAFAQ